MSYEAALEEAKATNRPVLIDFTGVNCANCRTVEKSIMPKPDVVEQLKKFVTVQLYTDTVDIDSLTKEQRKELADDNLDFEEKLTEQITSPLYVVVTPDGKKVAQTGYSADTNFLRDFLKGALAKYQGVEKVASQ